MNNTTTKIDKPYAGRWETIKSVIPHLAKCKSVLYVGAKRDRGGFLLEELRGLGCEITIVEAFKKNCDSLQNVWADCNIINDTIESHIELCVSYDAIVWWHGPEHLKENDAAVIISKMMDMATVVLLGSPCGMYEQGAAYGNEFEVHQWAPYPDFYNKLGMDTHTLTYNDGSVGRGSHITAWRIKE